MLRRPRICLVTALDRVRREAPVSDLEVIIRAEQIERAARMADARQCQDLFRELEALVGTVPEAWWRSPALCAAVAAAYGELNHFEAAIRYYERVTTAERADAPVRALEQLANLRVRWASTLVGKDTSALGEASWTTPIGSCGDSSPWERRRSATTSWGACRSGGPC